MTRSSGKLQPWLHTAPMLVCLALASACQKSAITARLNGRQGGDTIEGQLIVPGNAGSTLALSESGCTPDATAVLYSVGGKVGIDPPLVSAPIDATGQFVFRDLSRLGLVSTGDASYMVVVEGCGVFLARIVTGHRGQDVSPGSTLLAYAPGLTQTGAASSIDAGALAELAQNLVQSPSTADAYAALGANAALSRAFQTIFGFPPSQLADAPPKILALKASGEASEHAPANFSVAATHWRPDYKVAYLWKRDDLQASGNANFAYTPAGNDQGTHAVTLYVGKSDASGSVDTAAPYITWAGSLEVKDTLAATPPLLTLASAAAHPDGARPVTKSRDLTLALATGPDMINCETFTALAVTENNAQAPLDLKAYTVKCAQPESQSLSYRLKTSGDGDKTLRLWAVDAAGHFSAQASELTVTLDETAPVFAALPLAGDAVDGFLNAAERLLPHALVGAATGTGFDTAAYSVVPAATVCDGSLVYQASLPGNNSPAFAGDGAYKVCVALTDLAGNPPAYGASTAFSLATALPSFTSLPLANDAVKGYVNAAEHSGSTLALVGAATGSHFDAVSYALTVASTVCSSISTYLPAAPKSNASAFGADGSYKVCAKLSDAAGNPAAYGQSPTFNLAAVRPAAFTVTQPSTPTNAATPTVGWSASSAGVTYSVAVATSSSCASPLQSYNNESGLSKTLTTLTANTYYVCVTATDASGNTQAAANSPYSFTVDLTPPGAFSVSAPAAASYSSQATVAIAWGAAAGAATYDLKIGLASGCPSASDTHLGLTATGVTTASLADGTYYVCLLAKDLAGNQTAASNDNLTFTVDTAPPGAFSLTAPAANINTATPTVTWSAATGADSYDMKVAASSGCSTPLQSYPGLTTTSQALSALSEGLYYICIQAKDLAGNATNAANTNFAFRVDLTRPTIASLALNSSATSTANNFLKVDLSAADTASDVTHFCLKYNSSSAPSVSDSCWVAVNAPSPGLTPALTLSMSAFDYAVGFAPGLYTVYAWVKDKAGNISTLTAVGSGTSGVDKAGINYLPGTPPTISNILAANSDAPSSPPLVADMAFTPGQNVYIKWRATDVEGLASQPISIYSTTDDINYTLVAANLANGQNGSCLVDNPGTAEDDTATGCYLWTAGAPVGTYFKVRVVAKDSSQSVTFANSLPLNVSALRFLAGNVETGTNASASSAVLFSSMWDGRYGDPGSLAISTTGRIFFRDAVRGLMTVSPDDGVLRVLIPMTGTASGDGGPVTSATLAAPYQIALDYQNNLLIYDFDRIRRVNTNTNPMTISTIIGGGSNTADTAPPLDVILSNHGSVGHEYETNMVFSALPDGRIFFVSEASPYIGAAGTDRVRIYDPASNVVTSLRPTGTGHDGNPSVDITTCVVLHLGLTFDPATSVIDNMVAFVSHGWVGTCMTGTSSMVNLNPTTYVATAPHPTGAETGIPRIGLNGELYYLYRGFGVKKFDRTTKASTTILGSSSATSCSDGTTALSCATDPMDVFVSQAGTVYFIDHGRLRTIDAAGNVQTIAGQSLAYGDGGKAISARFNNVASLSRSADGKIVVLDDASFRLREFTPDGNIDTIAGNGIFGTADTVNPASSVALSCDDFVLDPATGEVFCSNSQDWNHIYLVKLDRGTGRWVNLVGGGATSYADPSADGKLGSEISLTNYGIRPLGFGNGQVLTIKHYFDGASHVDSMMKLYRSSDGLQSHLVGRSGPLGPGTICADGTSLTNCDLPSSLAPYISRASYDSDGGRWLVHLISDSAIRAVTPGVGIATLVTLPRGALSFAYRRTADLSTNKVYYCATDGRLYQYDLTNSTETALNWPIASMTCGGRSIEYDASANSILFAFRQNGLMGVAEYFLP